MLGKLHEALCCHHCQHVPRCPGSSSSVRNAPALGTGDAGVRAELGTQQLLTHLRTVSSQLGSKAQQSSPGQREGNAEGS